MTTSKTETLLRTEGLRRDEMKEPDEVSAMLRLKALGSLGGSGRVVDVSLEQKRRRTSPLLSYPFSLPLALLPGRVGSPC
jgi:hypothetical protein